MLRDVLPSEGFDVVSVGYPQEDCLKAVGFLNGYIRENDVDIVVGSSLGAFITLNLNCDVPRVVINPCMEPFKVLALAGVSEREAESYREATENIWNHERCSDIFGFFADDDELFGTRYRERFGICYGDWSEIHSRHHLNEGCMAVIASKIKEFLNKRNG